MLCGVCVSKLVEDRPTAILLLYGIVWTTPSIRRPGARATAVGPQLGHACYTETVTGQVQHASKRALSFINARKRVQSTQAEVILVLSPLLREASPLLFLP